MMMSTAEDTKVKKHFSLVLIKEIYKKEGM